jgi:hypothetical protein
MTLGQAKYWLNATQKIESPGDDFGDQTRRLVAVMAGLVPAIHV